MRDLNEVEKKLTDLSGSPSGISSDDPDDQLNSDFIKLAKEASQLHRTLASSEGGDDVSVRNRLTNVKVKLSDVQKRLRAKDR